MNSFFIILSMVIGFATSDTVKWEIITDTFLNSSEQELRFEHNVPVNLIYKLEVTAKLSENSTISEQNHCVYNFFEILENKVNIIRRARRQEQAHNSDLVTFNSNAPYKKNVKKFSVHDIAEIFPVFKIEISAENNLAFIVVMTDKVYSELNKRNVRSTSWFPKVLAAIHTPPEKSLKEFRTFSEIPTKQ